MSTRDQHQPEENPDDPVARVRDEIRRAGAQARRLRAEIVVLMILFVVVGAAVALREPHPRGAGSKVAAPNQVSGPIAFTAMAGVVAAMPLAATVRRLRRRRLRDSQAALLDTLRRDGDDDTRKLAHGLCRDLDLPTEVSPAAQPSARGDEATPAP